MDIFTKELGPSYVPAFAARLLVAMAKGIGRASEALKRSWDEDAEGMWTLALVVVRWYADSLPAPEAKAVAEALPDPEMVSILANLNGFRERLLPFVRTAYQAQGDAQLAAAGVYFVGAVEQIGLPMLSAAIKSGPVSALHAKVQARLPLPADVKTTYYQEAFGAQPKGTTVQPVAPTRPSRSDRFDRADYSPRSTRTVPQTAGPRVVSGQTQARAQTRPAPSAATPPRPPTPQLANADVARAYLHTLGWEGNEVDRLLAGPDGKKSA